MSYKLDIKSATYDGETKTLTIQLKSGTEMEFEGEGTVWYFLPLMGRCSTSQELQFSEIYRYVKRYGNPYPTAHLNEK